MAKIITVLDFFKCVMHKWPKKQLDLFVYFPLLLMLCSSRMPAEHEKIFFILLKRCPKKFTVVGQTTNTKTTMFMHNLLKNKKPTLSLI